jgi:ATPase family associated with various cellular activities (AAA)
MPTSLDNIFDVAIDEAAALLRALTDAGDSVMLWGSPGIGKTEVTHQVGAETDRKVIDFRANLREPVDLRGIPVPNIKTGTTKWLTPDELPQVARDGKRGIFFCDEINTASTPMQAALFQLIQERKIGDYVLPEEWVVVAAGNHVLDRAAAQRMPTALRNRFAHLNVVPSVAAWAKWAVANGVAPEMIAFVRFRPELIHRMPRGDENAFPTPRSLTKAAKYVNVEGPARVKLFASHVGRDVATEIDGYIKLYQSLGSLEDIIENPTTAKVPTEASERYAVCTGLARLATRKNFKQVLKYADRLSGEPKMLLMHDATLLHPELKETAEYSAWTVANQDLIMQSH